MSCQKRTYSEIVVNKDNFLVYCTLILSLKLVLGNDFSSPPTTVKAIENNTVLLPCYLNTLSNDEAYAVAVRWYKGEDLLGDSGNETVILPERHILWDNGSLEIRTVQPPDTGEYTCEVIRPEPWGAVKQRHAIEVLHPPSVEPFPLTGFLQVKLGEEVRMSCKADGVPYPLITWTRKGEELKLLDHRELLIFTGSDRYLAGEYECIAANGVGEPARAKIQLSIIYPPEIMTLRSWIHTAPGHRAQIECRVSADPQAIVTWLKGDVVVPLDNRVVSIIDGDKHILLIRNVQRSDFGIYTCRAINELGQGEVHIQLSGVPNPGVFKRADNNLDSDKTTYTLIWEVDSYTPIIEYSLWFRPYRTGRGLNRPDWTKLTIPTEHNSGPVYSKSFTLKGLKEKTIYEVLLVSRNRYGWSKPSPILRFASPGATLNQDMITTVQIGTQENSIPLDFRISSAGSQNILNIGSLFIVVWFLFKIK
ncbi:neurotrimin-like [Sitophilus oryzae]|uniref:Neurotrimin-like n=1 Tax=Sitophilus oryzae TaxID=7048 RepID=A0A6J2XP24_SITOR|nr:neurotrimin-like [Sitophilus oryzae]XP_030752811.1 neurotrimin-like [Sitophilus oryzae]XP_030752812.1 neurotrimin-like [Sitophilus oryzae]XP_030752813.1 neurotrimin-like [Sitophilus oryzae]XP_030752814.1 neurotrimin-like [Sitophilus oryzae]